MTEGEIENKVSKRGLTIFNDFIFSLKELMDRYEISYSTQNEVINNIKIGLLDHQTKSESHFLELQQVYGYFSRLGKPIELLQTINLISICPHCKSYYYTKKSRCQLCHYELNQISSSLSVLNNLRNKFITKKYLIAILCGLFFGILLAYYQLDLIQSKGNMIIDLLMFSMLIIFLGTLLSIFYLILPYFGFRRSFHRKLDQLYLQSLLCMFFGLYYILSLIISNFQSKVFVMLLSMLFIITIIIYILKLPNRSYEILMPTFIYKSNKQLEIGKKIVLVLFLLNFVLLLIPVYQFLFRLNNIELSLYFRNISIILLNFPLVYGLTTLINTKMIDR